MIKYSTMINITPSQELTKIYLVTNCFGDPNKVYIGKTKNNRESSHRKTYGKDIIYTYIDQVESFKKEDWKSLECFWIEYFKFLGFDLQNKNKGGNGVEYHTDKTRVKMSLSRQNISQETREKMRISHTGRKFSEESRYKMSQKTYNNDVRQKISQSHKGIKKSEEHKLKIKNSKQNISIETRLKMSLAKQNMPPEVKNRINKWKENISQETKDKIGISNSKPINQYDKQGNFIREWPNALTVNKILGIDRSDISRVCKGRGKTAGGFIWKYKL